MCGSRTLKSPGNIFLLHLNMRRIVCILQNLIKYLHVSRYTAFIVLYPIGIGGESEYMDSGSFLFKIYYQLMGSSLVRVIKFFQFIPSVILSSFFCLLLLICVSIRSMAYVPSTSLYKRQEPLCKFFCWSPLWLL